MSANAPAPVISTRISNPLREVAQRQWTVLAARGVLQTLVVGMGLLLVASLLLGYATGIPVVIRILLALAVWTAVIWSAVRGLRPALHRWNMSRAAQFAELSVPDSEERISSAVELSQSRDDYRGSPQLLAHLMQQAEQDASRVNASAVIPYAAIGRWALMCVPVLALWMVLVINGHTRHSFLRGLFSMLEPWKSVPLSLADIAVLPGDQTVAQGDSLQIVARISADGGKRISQANLILTYATGQSISQNLVQESGTKFELPLNNLQQSFTYKVSTDRGVSPTYSVTVNPRPAIARLDVKYDFPKYTALETKTLTANDGNIDAVVGTKITLIVHTTDSLAADKSQLVFDDGRPTQSVAALTPTAEKNVYEAKFDVAQSGDYHIKLLNQYNLGMKEDQARAVTARADEAPAIAISSPKEQITVRPDDDVSVMYLASDDFGVDHIDVLLQIDDKPERTAPVAIHSKNRKNIKDAWTLSVPAILRMEGVAEATRISYQLKATDNRDPDPQTGLSARQTLLISKNETKSFQDKLNEMRKEDLQAAIRKAIERLNVDGPKVAVVRDHLARLALREEQVRDLADVRDHISLTGKGLAETAGDYLDTPFAEVAKAAKEISDNQIAQAADNTAKIALDGADIKAGHSDGEVAYGKIIDARDALEQLLRKVEEAEKKAEAAQALKDAAKKQEEVAKEMAEHPEKQLENKLKQQEAIKKLEEAMRKDPTLQNRDAQQLAQKLAELENKVEQEQQKQTDLQNQSEKQEEKQQAQEAANALAEEQKKLNEEVKQFAKDDKKPLEQAQAQAPDANQQQDLVKKIEQHELQNAAQQAQQQADQLKQDAKKLEAQAAKPTATADQQKQQQQDQQNQQDAKAAEKQADQAAKDLQKQENAAQPNAGPAKDAAAKVEQAAQQVQQQADKVEKQNDAGAKDADVQKAAEAAKADAQQAAQEAQQAAAAANPQDAQKAADQAGQELAKAATELNQAAQAEAKADQAAAKADNQQAAAQAADQAKDLAAKQQEIAKALQQQAQQQADAAAAPAPQQSAQPQLALAQQTQQAQQAAQQLAQQAQAQQDPALAQRADAAAKALDQAAQAQQDAAKADAAAKPADAAQAQADAQKALAKADKALRGATDPAQAQAAADPAQAQADAGQPPQAGQPDAGQPDAGKPDAGQGQPQQTAAQAAQEAAQAQQQALQPNPAAAAEAAQALAQAAQAAEQGLPGQGPPEQGTEPGTEPGEHPHPVADPKLGIAANETGGDNKPPAAVLALGISASDWAKLPPIMQKELMNASQQSGPPAYKEMIKNYYVRVAQMQNQRPDAAAKQ
ncbi:MAG TPA: DUF4175 family protein [Tepidisphaeraceae bacterium]|jgi:hypothetical protein|nr:DUF4175 family protein [Tepidisphaeraceae bacterium]